MVVHDAYDIARGAGLLIRRIAGPRVARVRGWVLEVGPDADPNHVATLGVRLTLYPVGAADERVVRRVVERMGHSYVPRSSGLHERVAK